MTAATLSDLFMLIAIGFGTYKFLLWLLQPLPSRPQPKRRHKGSAFRPDYAAIYPKSPTSRDLAQRAWMELDEHEEIWGF